MSLADDAKLLLIPTAYKSEKVYSVYPINGDGDFSYSRSGDATRVNTGGFIEELSANIPRIDHFGGGCPSLLLESQRTNLVLFSEQFSGTNWGTLNTTITANQTISLDGQFTADKLQRTSTSASYRSHNISKSASAITYTTSVFIKKGSDDYFAMRAQGSYPSRVDIRFRFDTEQIYYAQAASNFTLINSGVENYQNGWYRLNFTYTSDTHTNLSIILSPRATDGNIDSTDTSSTSFAYVWGAQNEVGNFVSSYIKTTTGQVTRQKDQCFNGGDGDSFNISEGTFFVDLKPYNGGNETRISLSNGTDSQKIVFMFQSNGTQIKVYSSGGVSNFLNLTFDQKNKIAVTFKANEYKFFINGALIGSNTNASVPIGMDRLNFSNATNIANYFEGEVYDIRVYNKVLTETEAIQLTQV